MQVFLFVSKTPTSPDRCTEGHGLNWPETVLSCLELKPEERLISLTSEQAPKEASLGSHSSCAFRSHRSQCVAFILRLPDGHSTSAPLPPAPRWPVNNSRMEMTMKKTARRRETH